MKTIDEIITGLDFYATFGSREDGTAIVVIRDNDDGEIVEVLTANDAGRAHALAIVNS